MPPMRAIELYARELLYARTLDKQGTEWCEVFDRGRATSLLLFESVAKYARVPRSRRGDESIC